VVYATGIVAPSSNDILEGIGTASSSLQTKYSWATPSIAPPSPLFKLLRARSSSCTSAKQSTRRGQEVIHSDDLEGIQVRPGLRL